MTESIPFSPERYDVSEAALKELYLDRDDDEDVGFAELVGEIERPVRAVPEQSSASGDEVAHSVAPAITPLRAPAREQPARGRRRSIGTTKKRRKIGPVILGLGAVLAIGWAAHRPMQTPPPRATDPARGLPAIDGLLGVADFAAGRMVNPGQSYGVDLPAGRVRVLVATGEVRLTSKDGETLRACSSEPFVLDAAGSARPAPLITACGREPALLQAEIPQPPLPAPAPAVTISPSTIRAGGD